VSDGRRGARPAHADGERGIVLIGLLVMLTTAGTYLLLTSLNAELATGRRSQHGEVDEHARLAAARAALMAYAVSYPERNFSPKGPGRFPCPSLDIDGTPATNCGVTNPTTGRLPFMELEPRGPSEDLSVPRTAPFRDGVGEPLWYAVADSHRYTLPRIDSDTGDTTDDLSLDGRDDIVAMVIAPGPPLAGQDRSDPNAIEAYLEGANATPGDRDFTAIVGPGANDRIAFITREALNRALERRVAQTVRNVLASIVRAEGRLPMLAPFAAHDPDTDYVESGLCAGKLPVKDIAAYIPTWLREEWVDHVLVAYGNVEMLAPACTEPLSIQVRPDTGTMVMYGGVRAVIIVAGRALTGTQDRSGIPPVLSDYFERDNADGDRVFEDAPRDAAYNDVTLVWEVPAP